MALLKHCIIVEATFGSAYQRDVAMRVIREYLEGWKVTVENGHRENEIIIAEHEIGDTSAIGTACPECERLRVEYERTERECTSAAALLRAHTGPDREEYMRLRNLAQNAQLDRDTAVLQMNRHREHCAIRQDAS